MEDSKDIAISLQAAIEIVDFECGGWRGLAKTIAKRLSGLPSAQLEPCEDAVSREKVFGYFVSLWECIGTIMDRDEWEDVCKTTANELPSAQPSFSQHHENDAYYDGYDNGYNAGFEAGQRDVLMKDLPSAQPEPLTDKEQRIFLAAMGREEKVCKQVDEECRDCREPYEDSLMSVCREIERKVKGALWPDSFCSYGERKE